MAVNQTLKLDRYSTGLESTLQSLSRIPRNTTILPVILHNALLIGHFGWSLYKLSVLPELVSLSPNPGERNLTIVKITSDSEKRETRADVYKPDRIGIEPSACGLSPLLGLFNPSSTALVA
jgi:hypothetical protein